MHEPVGPQDGGVERPVHKCEFRPAQRHLVRGLVHAHRRHQHGTLYARVGSRFEEGRELGVRGRIRWSEYESPVGVPQGGGPRIRIQVVEPNGLGAAWAVVVVGRAGPGPDPLATIGGTRYEAVPYSALSSDDEDRAL